MAAKQTVEYRGHVIRVWEKSYKIDQRPLKFIGVAPDLDDIKDEIDRMHDRAAKHYSGLARRARIERAVRDWFELHAGDLHRQVYYAWRDYPDGMRMSLIVGFMAGAIATIVALIVTRWALGL